MAARGVQQLKSLTLSYCRFGGSSSGVRNFLAEELGNYANANPNLKIVVELRNGKHPLIEGEYVHGRKLNLTLKNDDVPEIMRKMERLRMQTGKKITDAKNVTYQWTQYPSIQGFAEHL